MHGAVICVTSHTQKMFHAELVGVFTCITMPKLLILLMMVTLSYWKVCTDFTELPFCFSSACNDFNRKFVFFRALSQDRTSLYYTK
jgi:hypothetical protein